MYANFENAEKGSTGIKADFAREGKLAHCDNRPECHLGRNPAIRSEFLGHKLRRHLGTEEGYKKDCIS
jgi:hypothetical protein